MFPGTCSPRNGSLDFFSCSQVALFKQDRGWDLFVEKYELEIMNEYGV